MPAPFDASPLTEPVDRATVRRWQKQMRAAGRVASASGRQLLLALGVFVVAGAFILAVFAAIGSSGGGIPVIAPLFVVGVVVTAVVFAGRQWLTGATRAYRLDRFAHANGLTYEPELSAPPLPGMIFSLGRARRATDLVRGARPRFVEFANYTYTTGSGKNSQTHRWGYVAVKLDVPLPHIVLDATGNNGIFGSNLPVGFSTDQRLGLEGDFDQHFALYCPEGYERDALYLFTPDIMARFVDHAAELDAEIVDDWLFLYARRPLSTLDPATWAWLFSVVGALLDKFAQWGRWRDDRLTTDAATRALTATDAAASVAPTVATAGAASFAPPPELITPPPGVAQPGRRLVRRFSWAWIGAAAIAILWFFGEALAQWLFERF